jgi:Flp pilus assembly pilin Flp
VRKIAKERKMKNMLKRFVRDESGTETVEWAIMIGLIAVAAIALIVAVGAWVVTKFSQLNTALASHVAVGG